MGRRYPRSEAFGSSPVARAEHLLIVFGLLLSACSAYDPDLLNRVHRPADVSDGGTSGSGGASGSSGASGGSGNSGSGGTFGSGDPDEDAGMIDTPVEDAGSAGRVRLTINATQVDADLTDFPTLVRIADSRLSGARTDGYDLLFSTDGSSPALRYQIERWDQSTGTLVAWVKLPAVADLSDTVFYLTYGDGNATDRSDPAGVWSSRFRAVYHMDYGGGTGTQLDSTSNANHAAPDTGGGCSGASQPVNQTNGVIGQALAFGANSCTRLVGDDSNSLDFDETTDITISTWLRATSNVSVRTVVSKRGRDTDFPNYQLTLTSGTYLVAYYHGERSGMGVTSSGQVTPNQWTHVVVTVAATSPTEGTCTFFIDGNQASSAATCILIPSADPLFIGGLDQETDEPFVGDLDEVRLASGLHSVAWIKAEYNNQRSGSDFLTAVFE